MSRARGASTSSSRRSSRWVATSTNNELYTSVPSRQKTHTVQPAYKPSGWVVGFPHQVLRSGTEDSHMMAQALVSFSIQQLKEASELQSKIEPTKGLLKTVETQHNYPDNLDQYWPISFPGAKRIKLVFDPRCSTEHNCDYVVIFKDGNHSSDNRWTPINYTGRQADITNKNWPGVDGRAPLYIDSDHCDIHFHSDGSNNDWGVKIFCYGIMKEPSHDAVEEFKAKKAQFTGSIEMACWLMEFISAEPLAAVRQGLYNKATLRTLRKYVEVVAPSDKIWMVHLVSSMLTNLGVNVHLGKEAVGEIRRMVASLKDLAVTQYRQEEAQTGEKKSPLLQALIQATVLGDNSPVLAPEYRTLEDEEQDDGVVETKEEVTLAEEKTDGRKKEPAVWGPASGVQLTSHARIAVAAPGGEPTTVLAAKPIGTRGPDLCRLNVWGFDGPSALRIGLAPAGYMAAQGVLGEAPGTLAWDGGKLYYGGKQAAFGTVVKPQDLLALAVDPVAGTVTVVRNKAKVGVALGPKGSGAAFEVEDGQGLAAGEHFVAVILPAGAGAKLMGPDLSAQEEALARSARSDAGSKGDSSAGFLEKIRDVVDYMSAFTARRIPSAIVRREFLEGVRTKNQVMLESAHPFDGEPLHQEVSIPGAVGLEVRLHWSTSLAKTDKLRLTGTDDQEVVLTGIQNGVDENSIGASISVGDMVVRGPAWEWGDQDGGAGSLGEVVEIKSWKGKSGAGVQVHWLETDYTALYRWGFEGHHDLLYVAPGSRCSRPLFIVGDTVTVDLETAGVTAAAAADTASPGQAWTGALRMSEMHSAVSINVCDELELVRDFSLEVWIRPNEIRSSPMAVVSRALDGMDIEVGDTLMHQLLLRVCPDGQVQFSMINQETAIGVSLKGGRVSANKWAHLAVTVQDRTVRLYVDGREAGSGSYESGRLESLGAPLVVGNLLSVMPFAGHVWDFRVWDRALTPPRLQASVRSPGQTESTEGLLVRLLSAPPSEAEMAENAGPLGTPGQGDIRGAEWDDHVEGVARAESSQPWGYKIKVLPIYPVSALQTLAGVAEEYQAFAERYTKGDMRHDLALVRYVNDVAAKKGFSEDQLLQCRWEDIAPSDGDTDKMPLIKELMSMPLSAPPSASTGGDATGTPRRPGTVVQARYGMIQLLNALLKDVLPLIDLGTIDKAWSMASLISRCRSLIYTMLKQPVWQNALESTQGASATFELRLSRSKALKFAGSGKTDDEGRFMVFSQAFRQIHPMQPRGLRRADKLYNVFWMGERSHDAGGPYRETWSVYCNELQSAALPLLRRTPNGVHSIGQNREQWVLNPGSASTTHFEMFGFMGKLMGIVSAPTRRKMHDKFPLTNLLTRSDPCDP
jgi:hypothetical protein